MNKKMRARKRRQARRVALTLVLMLTVALVSIGGTIAWLTDSTGEVKNTFTVGNITIDLKEHKYNGTVLTDEVVTSNANYKMVPGATLPKDPYVTVEANSEACWLFVEITENGGYTVGEGDDAVTYDFDDFISYTVDGDNWTAVPDTTNVYYTEVSTADAAAGKTYYVLENNEVSVAYNVTKEMMDTVSGNTQYQPTLTFKAYAIQSANLTDMDGATVTTAAGAWALLNA